MSLEIPSGRAAGADPATTSRQRRTSRSVTADRHALRDLQASHAELEHQVASQRRLLETTERLLTMLDPQGVLEAIADTLRDVVSYDNLTIYRLDRERARLAPILARDRFAELIMNTTFPIDAGITGWVIRHAEAQVVNEALSDPRTALIPGTPAEDEALIVVPLVADGEVMGTLNLGRIGGPEVAFSEKDFELTKLFGARASIALRNALAHREVAERAETDPLTGLLNRAAFQKRIDDALIQSGEVELSLLMLDLDHFKVINDLRGHPHGDTLLQAIADAFRGETRDGDSVYRYGGDEFVVLLPETGTLNACEIGQRICQAVRAAAEAAGASTTVSVGVATYPHDGRTRADLLEAADEALYRAKAAGGKRVAFRAGVWSAEGLDGQGAVRALELERATVAQRLRLRNTQLTALYETTLSLLESLDPAELLGNILERAAELLATPHAYLYMVVPDRSALEVTIGLGLFEQYVGYRLAPGEGLAGRVWSTAQPVAVSDYTGWEGRSSRFPSGDFRATVGVPLTSEGEVVGVLGISYEQPGRTFGDDDVAMLSRFAELASVALRNAQLYDSARRELAEERRVEDALRTSEARFRALVQHSSDMISINAADGSPRYVSPSVERMLGYSMADLESIDVFQLMHPDDADATQAIFTEVTATAGATGTTRLRLRHRDGTWRSLESTITNLLDDPAVGGIVINSRDLTDEQALQEELTRQAFYDSLTSLPNRALFTNRLEHALSRGGSRHHVAVLLLDLDRFKVINDSLGHAFGDRLLVEVAGRLERSIQAGDTVARFGGDEFAILLDRVSNAAEASLTAERVLAELAAPFRLDGRDAFVSASIGIAASRRGRARAGDVIRDADIALYRAKADTSTGFVVFDPRLGGAPIARLELESDLRQALVGEELELRYQPMVALASGEIVAVEALVRWRHPRRGLLEPAAFISMAEETGLILPLGEWVLRRACEQAVAWQARWPELIVSVNLSGLQFHQPDFAEQVDRVVSEAGMRPSTLELEITETVAMGDREPATATLSAFKRLGLRLAIDDFGTGYSSLGALKRLPVDALKIDRSFVHGLGRSETDDSIARALIALGHALGMEVVAEGIETSVQLERLIELGCDRGQGYHFSRPLTAEAVGRLLGRPPRKGRAVPTISPSPPQAVGAAPRTTRAGL